MTDATTPADALVAVTQADRDAVQAFHRIQVARIINGDRTLGDDKGDAGTLVQAFARHRLSALADQRSERGGLGLREALEQIEATSFTKPGAAYEMVKIARKALPPYDMTIPAAPTAPECRAESLGLRIAERIRQEMTSGRQWWLDALSPAQREEFEADLVSTSVAVCEDECALLAARPLSGEG